MSTSRIMIVEDEATVALDLKYTLSSLGYEVISIEASAEEAVEKAGKERPDAVLMDIHLRDQMDGIEAADLIRDRYEIPVVFLTAFSDDEMLERAKQVGSFGYLVKPCQERELYAAIEMALYKAKTDKEHQQMEVLLRQTAKLEGFHTMAGSIAHNFNNILQATQGFAQLAQDTVEPGSKTYSYLQKVNSSVNRATEINHLMLLYVGQMQKPLKDTNLSQLLRGITSILQDAGYGDIPFALNLTNDEGLIIKADTEQLQQLILNLFTNAVEAIGDGQGDISINTWLESLETNDHNKAYLQEDLHAGDYIVLEFVDTGCGIEKEFLEKIFDPFYTSKMTGRGLGLATILGIVRSHNGAIEVDSKLGEGTTFRIYFPISSNVASKSINPLCS